MKKFIKKGIAALLVGAMCSTFITPGFAQAVPKQQTAYSNHPESIRILDKTLTNLDQSQSGSLHSGTYTWEPVTNTLTLENIVYEGTLDTAQTEGDLGSFLQIDGGRENETCGLFTLNLLGNNRVTLTGTTAGTLNGIYAQQVKRLLVNVKSGTTDLQGVKKGIYLLDQASSIDIRATGTASFNVTGNKAVECDGNLTLSGIKTNSKTKETDGFQSKSGSIRFMDCPDICVDGFGNLFSAGNDIESINSKFTVSSHACAEPSVSTVFYTKDGNVSMKDLRNSSFSACGMIIQCDGTAPKSGNVTLESGHAGMELYDHYPNICTFIKASGDVRLKDLSLVQYLHDFGEQQSLDPCFIDTDGSLYSEGFSTVTYTAPVPSMSIRAGEDIYFAGSQSSFDRAGAIEIEAGKDIYLDHDEYLSSLDTRVNLRAANEILLTRVSMYGLFYLYGDKGVKTVKGSDGISSISLTDIGGIHANNGDISLTPDEGGFVVEPAGTESEGIRTDNGKIVLNCADGDYYAVTGNLPIVARITKDTKPAGTPACAIELGEDMLAIEDKPAVTDWKAEGGKYVSESFFVPKDTVLGAGNLITDSSLATKDVVEFQKLAYYGHLEDLVRLVDSMNPEHYRNFEQVEKARAEIVYGLDASKQSRVAEYFHNLSAAVDALETDYANYREVEQAICDARALDPSEYENFNLVEDAINAVVPKLPPSEQATVDGFGDNINSAVDQLVYKKADYTGLRALKDEALALNSDLYVNYDTVTTFINEDIDWTYDIRYQHAVNVTEVLLKQKIDGLIYKEADYSAVDEAIARAYALDTTRYVSLDEVYRAIEAVEYGKDITQQAQVDAYAKAINDALGNLGVSFADYTEVRKAIAEAEALNPQHYTNYDTVLAAIEQVEFNKPVSDQSVVDGYAEDIRSALKGLQMKGADYTKVDALIEEAEALNPSDYTNFAAVETAIAQVVRGKTVDEQSLVDGYEAAIQEALDALVDIGADYSEVDKAIAEAEALDPDQYVSMAEVDRAVKAVVRGKPKADQAVVDGYAKVIRDAISALELKGADYTEVDKAIAEAEALNRDWYVSMDAVDTAVGAVIRGKGVDEQVTVDGYATAIRTAIRGLRLADADYSKVDAAVLKAEGLNRDHYVSMDAVDTAVDAVVLGKKANEQTIVDGYATAIEQAIKALRLKDADYSDVNKAISEAQALDREKYVSMDAVDQAVDAVVTGKKIDEQSVVNGYATAIRTAISALELKGADYSKVDAAIFEAEGLNRNHYVSMDAVDTAVGAVVRGKAVDEQATVDGYAAAIKNAITGLELKDADYSKVEEAILKAQSLDRTHYVSFAGVDAAVRAALPGKKITEQATVDGYAEAINDAIGDLELILADYSKVDAAILEAEDLNRNHYVSMDAVDTAVGAVIRGKGVDEQAAVDGYVAAIKNAIAALELKDADYSDVQRAVSEANALNRDHYESMDAVDQAVDAVVTGKKIDEQTTVDGYAAAIRNAISGLTLKDADYTKVNEAVKKAESLDREDYVSFDEVDAAIDAVQRDKTILEQEEVDGYAEAILRAIENLEYNLADYSKVEEAIAEAETLDRDDYINFYLVERAIRNVDWEKTVPHQDEVDQYAEDIYSAIDKLQKRNGYPVPPKPAEPEKPDVPEDPTGTKVTVTTPEAGVWVETGAVQESLFGEVEETLSGVRIIGGKDCAASIYATQNGSNKVSFLQPLTVTVDLTDSAKAQVKDTKNLTLARVSFDATGKVSLEYMGGTYHPSTGQFVAKVDEVGNYILVERDNLIKIVLTVGNTGTLFNDQWKAIDSAPIILNGRTMVPLRFVGEALGCQVDWDEVTRSVRIAENGKTFTMTVDQEIPGYGQAPVIRNDRTLVPIRYISESLGANVIYDPSVQEIIIVK